MGGVQSQPNSTGDMSQSLSYREHRPSIPLTNEQQPSTSEEHNQPEEQGQEQGHNVSPEEEPNDTETASVVDPSQVQSLPSLQEQQEQEQQSPNPFHMFLFGRRTPSHRNQFRYAGHNNNNNSGNEIYLTGDGIVHLPSTKLKIPPASKRFIRSLPTLMLEHDAEVLGIPDSRADSECMICFQSYKSGSTIVSLPFCAHTFHKECLTQWLERQCTCPYCRYEFPTDDPIFEMSRLARMSLRHPPSSTHSCGCLSTSSTTATTATTTTSSSTPTKTESKGPMLPRRQSLVKILQEKQDMANARAERRLVLERLSFLCEPFGPPRRHTTTARTNSHHYHHDHHRLHQSNHNHHHHRHHQQHQYPIDSETNSIMASTQMTLSVAY